jgi:hypothetical protein
MSAPAKNLIRFLAASAAFLVLAVALNFAVDPLQLFRPARLFAAMYSQDTRMQDAGLIRSQDFDTVFMGTSLAIHFRQSEIDRALGTHSLKLAMTGSTSREQSFVLAAALERRPKRVIWEMDDWIFVDSDEIDKDVWLPADLYRRNIRGIASYLFSGAMTRESLWILLRSIPPLRSLVASLTNGVMFSFPLSDVDDIYALRPDFDVAGTYNAEKAMAEFLQITSPSRAPSLGEGYNYDAEVRNFERDAIGLIAKHPDVVFDIYFPPYSILQWVAMRDASPATLNLVYDLSATMSARLVEFPNVRLFDFRAADDITHDLNNYQDVIHHSPVVDRKILAMHSSGLSARTLAPRDLLTLSAVREFALSLAWPGETAASAASFLCAIAGRARASGLGLLRRQSLERPHVSDLALATSCDRRNRHGRSHISLGRGLCRFTEEDHPRGHAFRLARPRSRFHNGLHHTRSRLHGL